MLWNSESDFVDQFIFSNDRIIKSCNYESVVLKELKTGYGRPDIALVQYDKEILNSRNIKKESISQKASYAISYLSSRRWVRTETLGQFLSINNRKLNSIINELINHNLITRKNHLIKCRPKSEIMAVKRILTYEAKLHNWKEAIDQAERHLWFTNESYVLLPKGKEAILDKISNECINRGIGLSVYDTELGLQTIIHPSKRGINNSPFIWLMNEKLMEVYYGGSQ